MAWFVPLLVLIGIGLVAWGSLRARRTLLAWLLRLRFARARRLEREAGELLERKGYRILQHKLRRTAWVEVDGWQESFELEADYLVRGPTGRVFVGEVKTGRRAPSVRYAPTRRQLLEYGHYFAEAEGLLLVDMERRSVREVRFPSLEERT
ncbi:MAG: hypothetical protein D6731_21305 [Planctomycetota bacterium]|nr:MAG: hypothetical protein D6731_21305 [Planctomycetota bacterium]